MTPLARSLILTATLLLGLLVGLVDSFLPLGLTALNKPSRKVNPTTGPPAILTTSTTSLAAAGRIDPEPRQAGRPDWLPKVPSGCEGALDCGPTEHCCDFVLFKMCCTDGNAQSDWAPVPIPVRPNDGYRNGY